MEETKKPWYFYRIIFVHSMQVVFNIFFFFC